MTVRRPLLVVASVLAGAGCSAGASHAPHAGVYTAEQAARGKDVYAGMCLSCHAGMGNHTGPVFRARWGGHDVQELYRFISENMPKNDPGSLAPDECAAVVAYLLQLNGMPAGSTPLPTDTMALKRIAVDTIVSTR